MAEGIDLRGRYTLFEAGFLIGRSPTTLRNQIYRGSLTARKHGRDYVVTGRELERYRRENRRERRT